MKIEVFNSVNSYLIRVDNVNSKEEIEIKNICNLADWIDKQPGFQVTEVIFMYAIQEAYIKVYSSEKKVCELQKLIENDLSSKTNF